MIFMKEPKNKIPSGTRFTRLVTTWAWDIRKVWKETRTFRECACDCWTVKRISQHNLICNSTRSCWCLQREWSNNQWSHHKTKDRIYRTWMNMRVRCNNPKDKSYCRYWGRWISVCEEWNHSFEKFYEDMWADYEAHVLKFWEKDTQIDRIDVNWNYCKENCRWATREEQKINKRKQKKWRRYKEYGFTLGDLAKKYHLWLWAIQWRLYKQYDWNMDELIKHLENISNKN